MATDSIAEKADVGVKIVIAHAFEEHNHRSLGLNTERHLDLSLHIGVMHRMVSNVSLHA